MLLNERTSKIILRESLRSPLYGVYDEFEIGAAMILEAETGYPYEQILEEGWFTDKLKSVGKFLKKNVTEPAKYAWAKHMPELYGQQTWKFWKRDELRKQAEESFAAVIKDLEDESDEKWSLIFGDIKKQVSELKNVPKGELPFPNMKSTDEFYAQLFGSEDWKECEKIFDALEKGENIPPEFTQGLFGKMATAKILFQNTIDASIAATIENPKPTKELEASANKKLKGMRDILQNYAQEVKEIYQTFENKAYREGLVDLILEAEEAEAPAPEAMTEEEVEQKSAEIGKALGFSEDRLNAMKARQSPIRPLIAAVILGALGAVGIKMGMTQLNDSIQAYEEMLKAKDLQLDKAMKELQNRFLPDSLSEIDVDRGYTQMVQHVNNTTSPLANMSEEAFNKMNISDFQQHAEDLGFGEDFWAGSGSKGKESYKILKQLIGENPNMNVSQFFEQSGQLASKMSGKTLTSPFGLKAGVGKLLVKGGKRALTKATKTAISTGVGGYTVAGMTLFGLPASLVGGIVAGGTAVGLLTVAAIRKWKGNRQKLLLQCIEALSDIKGPREKAVEAQKDILKPIVKQPDIPLDPKLPKPDPEAPGPEFDPNDPGGGGGDDGGGSDTEGCEQSEKGLVNFMKRYDKDSDFSGKAGDGRPKKMSTMFDGPKLEPRFKELPPEKLQADLDATAKKYNELLNADIFTVSDNPEDIEEVAEEEGVKDSYNRSGTVLQERWAKLAGLI